MALRDLLTLDDLTASEINGLADRAMEMARAFETGSMAPTLKGKRVGLIVDDGGWRNTAALDLGMQILGAHCTRITASVTGKEAIVDLGRYLGNWFHLIAIRSPTLEKMTELADASEIPIMNLRTRQNHPCETLGDLSFIKSRRGHLEDLVVVAVAPADNIIHSWAEAAGTLPLSLIQIYPRAYWIDPSAYASPSIKRTTDFSEVKKADVLITDCWPRNSTGDGLRELRITAAILDQTKDGCLFIPCPPVTRGEEVSEDAMRHSKCVAYQAKAFLMHAQNAFIEAALSGVGPGPLVVKKIQ